MVIVTKGRGAQAWPHSTQGNAPSSVVRHYPCLNSVAIINGHSVTIIIGAYGASTGHLLTGQIKLEYPGSRCLSPLSTKQKLAIKSKGKTVPSSTADIDSFFCIFQMRTSSRCSQHSRPFPPRGYLAVPSESRTPSLPLTSALTRGSTAVCISTCVLASPRSEALAQVNS